MLAMPKKKEEAQPVGTSAPMSKIDALVSPAKPKTPTSPAEQLEGGVKRPVSAPETGPKVAPVGSAPAPSASNGFGDQSSLMPQTAGQAGTGYVNLSRVLGANLGAGGAVSSLGKGLIGKESAAYNADATRVRGQASGTNLVDPTNAIGMIRAGRRPSEEDLGTIGSALNASYSGPMSIGHDINDSDPIKKALGLANSRTAGRVLANEGGVTGGYSPKLSAIDAAIYGGVPDAKKATQGVRTGILDESGRQAAGNRDFAALVKGKQGEAEALRNSTSGALRGISDQIVGDANAAATRANNFNNAYGNGPAATANNFLPQDSRLNTISGLLNDPTVDMQSSGAYRPTVRNAGQLDPNSNPLSQFHPPTAPSPEQYEAERTSAFPNSDRLKKMYQQMQERAQWEHDHPEYGQEVMNQANAVAAVTRAQAAAALRNK